MEGLGTIFAIFIAIGLARLPIFLYNKIDIIKKMGGS